MHIFPEIGNCTGPFSVVSRLGFYFKTALKNEKFNKIISCKSLLRENATPGLVSLLAVKIFVPNF